MADYLVNNPEIIVNGFIWSGVLSSIDGKRQHNVEDQDDNLEEISCNEEIDEEIDDDRETLISMEMMSLAVKR